MKNNVITVTITISTGHSFLLLDNNYCTYYTQVHQLLEHITATTTIITMSHHGTSTTSTAMEQRTHCLTVLGVNR